MQQLRYTPFHERTSALCQPQNWRRWAGYFVVGSYELTIDREYWAIRNAAGLIDVTPLMKYMLKGRDAAALLHRVTTRNIHKMSVGQVYYTGWCDDEGKMIDDGTVKQNIANSLSNSNSSTATSNLIFGSGSTARLQLNNFDAAVTSLVSSNTNAIVENGGGSATRTLTVMNGADNTYAGILQNGSNGVLALSKSGGGTLTLQYNAGLSTSTQLMAHHRADLERQGAHLSGWGQSPWLKGELVLTLDDHNEATVDGWRLTYDADRGLRHTKERES